MGNNRKWIGYAILVVYVLILFDVLILARPHAPFSGLLTKRYWEHLFGADGAARFTVNLQPFRTISGYLRAMRQYGVNRNWWHNLAGNAVLFSPMGFLLPALFPSFRRFFKTVLFIMGTVVCFEILQFVTSAGACDIDDVILNTAGSVAGYLLFLATGSGRHRTDDLPEKEEAGE